VPQNAVYPHAAPPLNPRELKVKPPPRLSELLPEERALLSEKELLEAASEEDEDLAFLLEYREMLDNLEKQRQRLQQSDEPPLLSKDVLRRAKGSSTSSTRGSARRSRGRRSTD